ncbi:MAG: hypothetical protein IJ719_21345 [Clostridia bacterium]|nr:hypothetical protein [Clostridia bacterium]
MAVRPVFVVCNDPPYTKSEEISFKYYSGMALSQAQKSIQSLHQACEDLFPELAGKIIEVSTKSTIPLGIKLSAFNLQYKSPDEFHFSVENVFQAGKCFENGEQYTDLLVASAYEAKKDPRIQESGNIISFKLADEVFPIEPKTFFYDWVYVNALFQNEELANEVVKFDAFTDIAFNPKKSINCQAQSASLFVSLKRMGLLEQAVSSKEEFKRIVYASEQNEHSGEQLSLFDYYE